MFALLVLSACDGSAGAADSGEDSVLEGETAGGTGAGPSGEGMAGSCDYESPFTGGPECREFVGDAWSSSDVQAACEQLGGEVAIGEGCDPGELLGRCILDEDTDEELQIVVYGSDSAVCMDQKTGCEVFGGGRWVPLDHCDGSGGEGEPGGGSGGNVFIPPTLECRAPVDGEPPGDGPDGQVCTWQAISASTEEGRHFADYASCDVIYTQRPYYAVPPAEPKQDADERLGDPAYVAELDWVRAQIASSACVCCHSDIAPAGASNWTIDSQGNWMDTFHDSGLALGAGWIDSTAFGAYPPADNNGFDRRHGIPSTDPDRMRSFFAAELEHRGLGPEDFVDAEPFGGPLHDQLVYEPGACEFDEGVGRDGRITWTGGSARYVYVLEAGSANPTIPPNLDLPEGTKWRVDVPVEGEPLTSGDVVYGNTPEGRNQRFPEAGAPDALVPGERYYLYVTKDVGIPITRCLFTY